ncbi:methyltransferase [Gammaproteobacteria bacterium AB-CW1]|uniref:Methyltransferase n=1 Tax=Natronospira elongata TaxID=3110268 RepID=A0AAP6JG14_9GAMM|nr:methyltransferase [Gammaproteobacteria bacterium AB-CW1]
MTATEQGSGNERVRRQYERFPYPTAEQDLAPWARGQVMEIGFPSLFFHHYWPRRPATEALEILIAGCGTSQAARYAAAHPRARITGIDLSRASLDACERLANEYGLENLSLQQMPLEDVSRLGEGRYDLVVSTGVIHHLPAPAAGLSALRRVVKPDGALALMLYAPHGRDAIYYLQEFCKRLGLSADQVSDTEVAQLKEMLRQLPASHPLRHRRSLFPDLDSPAELVDYLLHPIDRPYTLEQANDLLENCGFRLQGLFQRGHYEPLATALQASPWGDRIHSLPDLERWSLGEHYRASLFKHEIIACPDSVAAAQRRLRAEDDDWQGHIPVPAPGLRKDFLSPPEGKAGVMSWPFHAFDDIRRAYDRREAAWIGRMDGRRPLAEIVRATGDRPDNADWRALRRLVSEMDALDFICLRGAESGSLMEN